MGNLNSGSYTDDCYLNVDLFYRPMIVEYVCVSDCVLYIHICFFFRLVEFTLVLPEGFHILRALKSKISLIRLENFLSHLFQSGLSWNDSNSGKLVNNESCLGIEVWILKIPAVLLQLHNFNHQRRTKQRQAFP